jgi:hypothetical protein
MILEEIDGDIKVIFNKKTLVVGDSVEDSQYALIDVLGIGKAIFRTGPSTTTEINGKPTPTPVGVVPNTIAAPATKAKAVIAPIIGETTAE